MITQSYDLNLIPGGVPVHVPVSRYDTGASRSLVFNLYYGESGAGTPFSVPSGSTITCDGTKPDGKSFSYGTTYSGSVVTVPIQQQMTAVSGEVTCQLTITNNSKILGTANFVLDVEQAAMTEDANVSQSEIDLVSTLVQQAASYAAAAAQSAAHFTVSVSNEKLTIGSGT